jgi:hypothetical protein
LEFGGNNGDNNNGNKTGAIHGPLIDEGISLVAFGRFRYWVVVCVCRDFSSSFIFFVTGGCA